MLYNLKDQENRYENTKKCWIEHDRTGSNTMFDPDVQRIEQDRTWYSILFDLRFLDEFLYLFWIL